MRVKRTIFYIVSPVIIILIFSLIHELSHGIVAILTGNEFKGIFFGVGSSPVLFGLQTHIKIINIWSYPYVCIAGSIGGVISSIILVCIMYKKKKTYLFFWSYMWLGTEILYWTISPYIKFGDAYNLCYYFKITDYQFFGIVGWTLHFISLFICIILFYRLLTERALIGGLKE